MLPSYSAPPASITSSTSKVASTPGRAKSIPAFRGIEPLSCHPESAEGSLEEFRSNGAVLLEILRLAKDDKMVLWPLLTEAYPTAATLSGLVHCATCPSLTQ